MRPMDLWLFVSATVILFDRGLSDPLPECPTKKSCQYKISTEVICEGKVVNISCAEDQKIKVIDALYGRDNTYHCPYSKIEAMQITNCSVSNAKGKVEEKCKDTSSCSFTANNNFFSEPCKGTFKYLRLSYACSCETSDSKETACQLQHACDYPKKSVSFVKNLTNQDVKLDDAITLYVVLNQSDVQVGWKKDGVDIVGSDHVIIGDSNSTHHLVITRVTHNDTGLYAIELPGGHNSSCLLSVTDPEMNAVFVRNLTDQVVTLGDPVKLDVELNQSDVQVVWEKDGVVIGGSDNVIIGYSRSTHHLVITRVTHNDTGLYSCELPGGDISSCLISVTDPKKNVSFIRELTDQVATLGDPVKLEVELNESDVEVVWKKEYTPIGGSDHVTIRNHCTTHQLIFYSVRPDDSGKYSCELPGGLKSFCFLTVTEDEEKKEKREGEESEDPEATAEATHAPKIGGAALLILACSGIAVLVLDATKIMRDLMRLKHNLFGR